MDKHQALKRVGGVLIVGLIATTIVVTKMVSSTEQVPSAGQTAFTEQESFTGQASYTEREGEKEMDKTVVIYPGEVSVFHDTNGDGMGEFEGFGTSLCWWANRIGGNEELTRKAGELFFNAEKGLGMNIGRYNIGGGDLVCKPEELPPEEERPEFLHAEHIIRSDSAVPGYCVDVTRIDLEKKTLEEYQAEFERVDVECGFAWNYDWNADQRQIAVLKAAMENSGEGFLAEAFSNSPPYFMTVSGCSSGHTDGSQDNLRADSYHAFATYLADVIEHWADNGIVFQSATGMNEPFTNYWHAGSDKQEGCHFSPGESQSKIIIALRNELDARGLDDVIVSASDETALDKANITFRNLSEEAKNAVSRLDTHTYGGTNRKVVKELAQSLDKNLWMSEVDGSYTAGKNAGQMSAALGLARTMVCDLNGLEASAWILWNAIDVHVDSSEFGQKWVEKGSGNDFLTKEDLYRSWMPTKDCGYWGLAAANHDTGEIYLTKKYYGYGQFSRYIRPGYTLMHNDDEANHVAAYDPKENKLIVVSVNSTEADETICYDLSGFEKLTAQVSVQAIRTSGNLEDGENWKDVSAESDIRIDSETNRILVTSKAHSITTYILQ